MIRALHQWMLLVMLSACTGGQISSGDTGGTTVSFASGNSDILGIVVIPAEVIVPQGSDVRLQAIALNRERESNDVTDAVDWASGSPEIAEVSNSLAEEGMLTGQTPGVTAVHAEFDGIRSSPTWVTVTDAELVRLAISPSAVSVRPGDAVQLQAEATFADGQSSDASSQVRWITEDGTVATLDGNGLLEAVSSGTTSVYIEWNGVSSDPIPITVSDEATVGGIDLRFDALQGQIREGNLEIFVDIRNVGDGSAEEFWVDLFVDPIIQPSFGDLPSTFHIVDYLGPGESTTVTFATGTPEDEHTFAVLLDSMEDLTETNEDNNYAYGDTWGDSTVDAPTETDGVLANLTFEYVGGFSSETSTEFWVDVKNIGGSATPEFYMDVFFDEDLDNPPALYDEGTVFQYQPELAPGEVAYASIVVPLTCGDCGSWILLDGFDFVDESNEEDNLAWLGSGGDWFVLDTAP